MVVIVQDWIEEEYTTSNMRQLFQEKLASYKQLIEADIARYVKELQGGVLEGYGVNAALVTDAYLDILQRGGKRLRGVLTLVGYEMCGGRDQIMIVQAARAMEMLHAYLLIIDDIQDRSALRRGGPAAHKKLADYHRQNRLAGDSEHFGVSLALNAALSGAHLAQGILANLAVTPQLRTRVLDMVNQTMVTTAHGQTNDIMHEVAAKTSPAAVDQTMEWKTAHYTFRCPLQVGMVLAGASDQTIDAINPYAMHLGQAFQIIDDINGTFGEESKTGKSNLDDLREGKRTLLTVYALEHAKPAERDYLFGQLGNAHATKAQLGRCQIILRTSNALDHARQQAQRHVAQAIDSIQPVPDRYTANGVSFLINVANMLQQNLEQLVS